MRVTGNDVDRSSIGGESSRRYGRSLNPIGQRLASYDTLETVLAPVGEPYRRYRRDIVSPNLFSMRLAPGHPGYPQRHGGPEWFLSCPVPP